MAFDFFSILPSLVNVGMQIYSANQAGDRADALGAAATAPPVDPFGAANRSIYQTMLNDLYSDPSYLENLPGYKFALDQGTKVVNRETARMGAYQSTNRGTALADYVTGLASQNYSDEAKRLATLAGANFAPSGSAFATLTGASADVQQARDQDLGDAAKSGAQIVKEILT